MNAGGRIADHRAALERRERSSEELARAALERASAFNPALRWRALELANGTLIRRVPSRRPPGNN